MTDHLGVMFFDETSIVGRALVGADAYGAVQHGRGEARLAWKAPGGWQLFRIGLAVEEDSVARTIVGAPEDCRDRGRKRLVVEYAAIEKVTRVFQQSPVR